MAKKLKGFGLAAIRYNEMRRTLDKLNKTLRKTKGPNGCWNHRDKIAIEYYDLMHLLEYIEESVDDFKNLAKLKQVFDG